MTNSRRKPDFKQMVIILCVCYSSIVFGTDYYIDNTCANNGNGLGQSPASTPGGIGPFNSLANAQTGWTGDQSGNRLLFKKGQSFSGQFTVGAFGTATYSATISSYGTGNAPIVTGGNNNIRLPSVNFVVIDGLHCINAGGEWGAGIYLYQSNNISILNCEVNGMAFAGTSGCHGIMILDSSNVKVDGCTIHDGDYNGIYAFKSDNSYPVTGLTISKNVIYNCKVYGICTLANYPSISRIDGSSSSIFENECYSNSSGIYIVASNGFKVYQNDLHDNGIPNATDAGEDYGFAIQSGSYNQFYDNVVSDNINTGVGVFGDVGTTSGPADGNKIFRNVIHGTVMDAWQRNLAWQCYASEFAGVNNEICYNIVYGSGANLQNFVIDDDNPGASGNKCYNNLFCGGNAGVVFGGNSATGWSLKNNIFAENGVYSIDANAIPGGITFSNNLYYKPGAGTLVRYNGTAYTSANISFLDAAPKTTDPLFLGTSIWTDFRLQVGSSAIDAGADLGPAHRDAINPANTSWPPETADQGRYGTAWEIGPFVYGPLNTLSRPEDNLDGLKAYPNPFNPGTANNGRLKIFALTRDSIVKIYTSHGDLVTTLDESVFGNEGWVTWDGRNANGEIAARGIYLVYVYDNSGNKKTIKIGLIK